LKRLIANNIKDNLQKNENIDEIIDILNKINNSIEPIKDSYYTMINNLNALNTNFPNIYNQLKYMCKLPDNNDINDINTLEQDIHNAFDKLSNKDFLKNFVN